MRSELTPAREIRPDLQAATSLEGESVLHEECTGAEAQDHGTQWTACISIEVKCHV